MLGVVVRTTNQEFPAEVIMLKKNVNCTLLIAITAITLVHIIGCPKNITEDAYQKITLDWELIKKNPDSPLQSCSFFICPLVHLTVGPFEETVEGKKYYGMEGYENDNINDLGSRVYKFLIRRRVHTEEVYSVLLESRVNTKIELLNFSGRVEGTGEYREGEKVISLVPGIYTFEFSGNQAVLHKNISEHESVEN